MNQKHINDLIRAALAMEVEDAQHADTLGFVARVLAQTTLPHSEPAGNHFTRRNGILELTITALSPEVSLPYGSIPRLLLTWLTTEAVRTRSPVLELGPTLSAFMAELDLARQGGERGDITRLRDQTVRLFSSAVSCRYEDKAVNTGLAACRTLVL